MKAIIKKPQVVAIYAGTYKVLFSDTDRKKVVGWAKKHRPKLKKEGAIKVIVNTGFYEK